MEFRKVFDTIPEQFDRYRPRYSPALFRDVIEYAGVGLGKAVLEIGPGTGQATDPILDTGCDYHAIELGEHLYEMMRRKYGERPNFHIVLGDFITHDFGTQRFLKPGGTLAMMLTVSDYKAPNPALYEAIQKVYDAHFKPQTPYTHGGFEYANAPKYGFVGFEKREYPGQRVFTAEEYVAFCGTHCDHMVIPEPHRSRFFDGLRDAVRTAGDRIVFNDTYILYLTRKPL